MTDRDVAQWYRAQHLSSDALDRLAAVRRPSLARRRVRWLAVAVLLLASFVGVATWSGRTTSTTPADITAVPPIPPRLSAPITPSFQIPDGMRRTVVMIGASARPILDFLNPGNHVDVLFTRPAPPGGEPHTETLFQSMRVLDVQPPVGGEAFAVALMATPEAHRTLLDAQAEGELVVSLRNDLDVRVSTLQGVEWLPSPAPGSPIDLAARIGRSRPGRGEAWRTRFRPRSTFGLDVDTASYTLARERVRRGQRPDPSQVRLEAFVNALPYEIPPPEGDDRFGTEVELGPSPWTEGYHLLRIGVSTAPVSPVDRPPLHLTWLIDASCSMSEQLHLVQDTLESLTPQLRDDDTVAVVRFSEQADVVLPPTSGTHPGMAEVIERLQAEGSTSLEAGLTRAYEVAAQRLDRDGAHRVVLCTDGMPNVGALTADALSTLVRPWTERGVGLTALGFGRQGYRDELMEAFADASDGNYGYIDGFGWGRGILVDRFVENFVVVARDAKAQVTWNPRAVTAWRQLGYADRRLADEAFRDDTADAGELGPGHQVTLLYEVRLAEGVSEELGAVVLRAEPPGWEGQRAFEQAVRLPNEPHHRFGHGSADHRIAAAAASLALNVAEHPMSPLSVEHIYWMAHDAVREGFRNQDEALLDFVRDAAGLLPTPEPPPRQLRWPRWSDFRGATEAPPVREGLREVGCRELTFIEGGTKRVARFDEHGNPCE